MSSTLAGNFTLFGSVANLKVGAPLTLVTLAAGTAWLMWRKVYNCNGR